MFCSFRVAVTFFSFITTNPTESGKSLAIDEAVDLATAIKAYTLESAYLMNQEDEVGSIATGRRADMVVLDTNLFEVVPSKISDANVLTTVFDGKVVFDRSRNPSTEVSIEDHHQVQLDLTGKEGHRCCIFCEMLLRRQASASER